MSITSRDLVVLGCCLVREFTSLKAFWYVARNWRRVLEKRAEIMNRRRVSDEYLASWFSYEPIAKPAPKTPARSCQPPKGSSAVSEAMRIALLGTRGIPANYGGFETFAEEISPRLVARGHSVTVYCRNRGPERNYLGVDLRYLPTLRHKYFDTLAHTFVSTLDLLVHRHDVALYCNAANAIFTWMPESHRHACRVKRGWARAKP